MMYGLWNIVENKAEPRTNTFKFFTSLGYGKLQVMGREVPVLEKSYMAPFPSSQGTLRKTLSYQLLTGIMFLWRQW